MAARGSGVGSRLEPTSSAEHKETKVKLSDLQAKHDMISLEAIDLRKQYDNYISEIECLNGEYELTVYRTVQKGRNKWEE